MSYLYVPPADKIVRRVAVGKAPRPAGRDGIDAAADDAHTALLLAPWEVSDKAPHMPVHEYDRALPDGDAWKGVYGYDETARTLRVAAGAVCYSFPIPSDAIREDSEASPPVSPAHVESLSVRVIGDRYLDKGAKVYVAFTEAPDPPSFAEFVAPGAEGIASSDVVCATAQQEVTPNERKGLRDEAEIDYGETPATPASFCHVCLALADYDDARGAWVEGGAQLDPESIGVKFDREVTAADPEPDIPRGWMYALETDGRIPFGSSIEGAGISFQMVYRMFFVYGTTDKALLEDVTNVLHEYHCERRRFRQHALRWCPSATPYDALNIDGSIAGNMYCALACVRAGTAVVNNPNDSLHARYCLSLLYSTCGILYTTPKTLVEGATLRFPGFRQMEAPSSTPRALSEPNTATGGATFRVALVEVPALPQIVDESKAMDMYGTLDEPPDFVRQIAAGHGDALVGVADITTGPEYTRPPQQSIKVIKTPTSPYLLLLILPVGITTLQHQEISSIPEAHILSAPTYGLRTADGRFRIGYGP